MMLEKWERGEVCCRERTSPLSLLPGIHYLGSLMTPPQKPLGMSDFFALEAGEYLERLDGLLSKDDGSSADEIVRLARALRGSALMANQHAIARVAAGLEALWRAVREGRRTWDAQARQLAVRAVDDLKIFVRQAGSWTDAHTAKAEALAQELEPLPGRPPARGRGARGPAVGAGARRGSAGARQLAVRAVDDLKIFVRQAGSWTDAHTAKAEART